MAGLCTVRLDFASASELEFARRELESVLAAAPPDLLGTWDVEAPAGLGARSRLSALVLGLTFAGGIAEGAAGNYVYDLIKSIRAAERTSVMGARISPSDRLVAQAEIVAPLREAGCLAPNAATAPAIGGVRHGKTERGTR